MYIIKYIGFHLYLFICLINFNNINILLSYFNFMDFQCMFLKPVC